MSFGSDTPGGAVEGIGGNESGIGLGGDGGSSSFSQGAMAAALAAAENSSRFLDWSNQQALDNDTERSMPGLSRTTGQVMDAYTAGHPEVADVVARQARENDWQAMNSAERQRAKAAAEQVGMNTDYIGSANTKTAWEKILNSIGSVAGGAAVGAFPFLGAPVARLGGKLGSYVADVRDEEEVKRAAGLLGPVVSPGADLYREGDKNSLAERIIWPLRKGIRG